MRTASSYRLHRAYSIQTKVGKVKRSRRVRHTRHEGIKKNKRFLAAKRRPAGWPGSPPKRRDYQEQLSDANKMHKKETIRSAPSRTLAGSASCAVSYHS
jgi:hypothetical protein